MRCPSCSGGDVGSIRFDLVASGASFHYCRFCEHRWWVRSSESLALTEVLTAARVLARAS